MDLIHRDNLPNELIGDLEKRFPGFKIACVGDAPEGSLPPEVKEQLTNSKREMDERFFNGICEDCGVRMPNFPKGKEDLAEDWHPAEGWRHFSDSQTHEPIAWQCPDCDKKEEEEG